MSKTNNYLILTCLLTVTSLAFATDSDTPTINSVSIDPEKGVKIEIHQETKQIVGPLSNKNFSAKFGDTAKKWQICEIEIEGAWKKDKTNRPSQHITVRLNGEKIFNQDFYGKKTIVKQLGLMKDTLLTLDGSVKNINSATHGRVNINAICDDAIITDIEFKKSKLLSDCNTGQLCDLNDRDSATTIDFEIDTVPFVYSKDYTYKIIKTNSITTSNEVSHDLTVSVGVQAKIGKAVNISSNVSTHNLWKEVTTTVESKTEEITDKQTISHTFNEKGKYRLSIYEIPYATQIPFTMTVTRQAGTEKIDGYLINNNGLNIQYKFNKLN